MERQNKLIYEELSYLLNGFLFAVHNRLGRFAREKQYGDAFEQLLQQATIPHQREFAIQHADLPNRSNVADFIIDEKILLEFKSKPRLFREDFSQVLRYLKCSGLKLGILVNFRSPVLKPHRILNSEAKE